MSAPPNPPLRCAVCGAPLGQRPAWIAPAPGGGTWIIHLEFRDCVASIVRKERRRAAS